MNIKLPLLLSEAHLYFLQKMKEKEEVVQKLTKLN